MPPKKLLTSLNFSQNTLTITAAKIMPVHDFPNIVLFKNVNRINLNFGVALIALDIILLRKIKSGCQLPFKKNKVTKKVSIFFSEGYCTKTKTDIEV